MFVPCAVAGSSVSGRYYDRSTIEQMLKTGRIIDPMDNTSPLGNAKAAPLEFTREIKAYRERNQQPHSLDKKYNW